MSESMKPWLLFAGGVLAVAALLLLLRDGGEDEPVAAAPIPAAAPPPVAEPAPAPDRPTPTRRMFAGEWTAIGRVTYVPAGENSSQPEGTVLKRPWKFTPVCDSDPCEIVFARGTLYGPSVTRLVRHRGYFTAEFPPVTVPCVYPKNYSYPQRLSGQSHDSYRLRWSGGGTELIAVERRRQTGCYPGSSPSDTTRWRATSTGRR